MGALRKAGVWLGLVEDEDDRVERGLFEDEFGEDDDFAVPAQPRSLVRPAPRTPEPDTRDRMSRDPRSDRDLRSGRDLHADRDSRADRDRDLRAEPRIERDLRADRDIRVDRNLRAERDLRSDREIDARMERDLRAADRDVRAEVPDPRVGEARARVRPLARPSTGSTALSFPTQDNLALAPQVHLRERGVVSDDKSHRRYQITTLHPTSYSEARAIGEHFRDGDPVIMNLTEMDEPDAKRLVDFAAGLAFGLRGSMERVTNRVFLLSPPNIRVSDEEKARIAEGGFFDQS
jgi:cell division inhibitor SepF